MKKVLLSTLGALSLSASVSAQDHAPIRRVIIEEATGTWCGYCVRGIVGMDAITESQPNVIGIAVHNGDPMANSIWDNALGNYIGGYPDAVADRAMKTTGELEADFAAAYATRIATAAPAHVAVSASIEQETRMVTVVVKTTFVEEVEGEYRFNAFVVEDNVSGTTAGYNQANYYAGGGLGPMGGFEDKPGSIPAAEMVYNHVGRYAMGGAWGEAESLPETIEVGKEYEHTFTYTLPEDYKVEDIHIVGTVAKYGGSPSSLGAREMVNSNITGLFFLDIEDVVTKHSLQAYPNPASDLLHLQFDLLKQEQVQVELINATGQIVYSNNMGQMDRGIQKIQLNTTEFTTGLYHMNLTIGSEKVSRKISIVH